MENVAHSIPNGQFVSVIEVAIVLSVVEWWIGNDALQNEADIMQKVNQAVVGHISFSHDSVNDVHFGQIQLSSLLSARRLSQKPSTQSNFEQIYSNSHEYQTLTSQCLPIDFAAIFGSIWSDTHRHIGHQNCHLPKHKHLYDKIWQFQTIWPKKLLTFCEFAFVIVSNVLPNGSFSCFIVELDVIGIVQHWFG